MGNNNTVVVTVTINGQNVDFLTKNGLAYVLTGTGKHDVACLVPVNVLVEKEAAINTKNYSETPLGQELAKEAGIAEITEGITKLAEEETKEAEINWKTSFYRGVKCLIDMSAERFVDLVIYSKINRNRFPEDDTILSSIVNADDCWCTAIIHTCVNEEMREKVFHMFYIDDNVVSTLRKSNATIQAKVSAYKSLYEEDVKKMVNSITLAKSIRYDYDRLMGITTEE